MQTQPDHGEQWELHDRPHTDLPGVRGVGPITMRQPRYALGQQVRHKRTLDAEAYDPDAYVVRRIEVVMDVHFPAEQTTAISYVIQHVQVARSGQAPRYRTVRVHEQALAPWGAEEQTDAG